MNTASSASQAPARDYSYGKKNDKQMHSHSVLLSILPGASWGKISIDLEFLWFFLENISTHGIPVWIRGEDSDPPLPSH